MSKFYITTPIYYVNDSPHIGHTYTTAAADVLARYHRMIGEQVFFMTGTDEHGAKIEERAKESGKKPQQFVNEISAQFQLSWDELNISHDNFIRTTDAEHIKAVQKALQYMYDRGDIVSGKYQGLYCRGCEQYKSERDLVEGICPDHRVKPEKINEECYSFKLGKYQNQLLKKIKNDELKILPLEKKNEIISFYEREKLQDVSFSRKNVHWGIPLPWDKSQTAYVWADAFLNYLTGLGWSGDITPHTPLYKGGKNPPNPPASSAGQALYQGGIMQWWPPDLQLMSKDILRVHATIWPAMLLSLNLPLPKQLFVHGYFLIYGQKMSKSLGNVITPEQMIKKYGVDGTRYLLLSATSFGHDADISWRWFNEKYNADLANGIGNLVARSITLAENIKDKKFSPEANLPLAEKIKNTNKKFQNDFKESWKKYEESFKNIQIDLALKVVNEQVKFLDSYITINKPWEMIKNNNKKTGEVIYNILESLRQLAWMIWPFMPDTADKIWESLGLDQVKEKEKKFKEAIRWGGLSSHINVKKSEALFPRITNLN